MFASWHDPIPALILATDHAAILRNDIYDRDPANRWGSGRITILGDAAHPMTPNLGQGACQAIEERWSCPAISDRAGTSTHRSVATKPSACRGPASSRWPRGAPARCSRSSRRPPAACAT